MHFKLLSLIVNIENISYLSSYFYHLAKNILIMVNDNDKLAYKSY